MRQGVMVAAFGACAGAKRTRVKPTGGIASALAASALLLEFTRSHRSTRALDVTEAAGQVVVTQRGLPML